MIPPRFVRAVNRTRPYGAHRFDLFGPKTGRRLTLFGRRALDLWVRLEADPSVLAYCERPLCIPEESPLRLVDFWVRTPDCEKLCVVLRSAESTAAAQGFSLFSAFELWSGACSFQLVERQLPWPVGGGNCRESGQDNCRRQEYPFNQKYLGERSLASYARTLANRNFDAVVRAAGAQQIGHRWIDDPQAVRKPATRPYEAVEFDGHKIDVRLTLRIDDPFGFETLLVLHRIWILPLLDVATRAVIGYALAVGREYNKDDIAVALQASLMPHTARASKIPALTVRPGGGFPSEAIPGTAWACWSTFRFDAAKAHFAKATLERLIQVVGCTTDNGPLGQKNGRALVERFFDRVASHFAHTKISERNVT
ncbi:hypothetical protein [Burkholderia ubonensis]|uniref:hypothetical protein n=1 Tax=Burkholderia ubonensis TaxID=101571 RepID=UPI000ADEA1A5|nr:hypothetical protein [Burkholderia ubonensis]